MPEESTKELMKLWQGRIELAQRYLDEKGNTDDRWTKNVKALAGDFNSENELGENAIDVNILRANVKTKLPPLYVSDPNVTVTPTVARYKGQNNVERARFTQIEINYWLRELHVRQEVKKIVYDGETTNLGYAYLGYTATSEEESYDYLPEVRVGRPFVHRVSPQNVLIPHGYSEPEECPWLSLIFPRPKIQVVERFGLTEDQADKLPTINFSSYDRKMATSDFSAYLDSDDAQMVAVHNCWCKETKKVYIIVPGYDDFLEEPKGWPVDVEGFPIVRYQPEHIPDEPFGTPPMTFVMRQQKELNATRTAMCNRRSRTKAVVIVDGAISEEFETKYKNARDGEIIRLDLSETEGPLSNHMMIDPGLPTDQGDLIYDGVIKRDMIEMDGVSTAARGAGDPNVDTATEQNDITRGTQVREADRADGVRSLYLGICRKLWMILKQHPSQKRTRLIAGATAGQMEEVEYTLEQLKGEFSFKMEMGTTIALTPQELQNRAALRYNLFRADPRVDPDKLVLDLLDAHNVTNPEDYLQVLRVPREEHELMSQGIPVEANERDEHQMHMEQHEQMMQQLDDALIQMDRDTPEARKASLMQTLLLAHAQDHIRKITILTGQQQPGRPIAENLMRNQLRTGAGTETNAELQGQPLNAERTVQ